METREARLTARVRAVNTANAYALTLYSDLRAIFEPLVGSKILKADGTLLASVAKLLPDLPRNVGLSVYRYSSDYSLCYVVKTCEPIPPHTCTYHETSVYVGNLRGNVLADLCKPPVLRADYTVEEIQGLRARYEEAKRASSAAESALYPFGDSDR